MKQTIIILISILLILFINECSSQEDSNQESNEESKQIAFQITGKQFVNTIKWVTGLANTEDNVLGRCFGVARRLKAMMPLVMIKMGMIVTTLIFLTIFALKSLGIGVLLLILNTGGLFGKLALLKSGGHEHTPQYYVPQAPQSPPQTIHFHIHKDREGGYKVGHGHLSESYGPPRGHGSYSESVAPTAWSDRVSSGLSDTKSLAEKLELINLYKRLGFNVNSVLSKEANGGYIYK